MPNVFMHLTPGLKRKQILVAGVGWGVQHSESITSKAYLLLPTLQSLLEEG
jgi:hypothetical protein